VTAAVIWWRSCSRDCIRLYCAKWKRFNTIRTRRRCVPRSAISDAVGVKCRYDGHRDQILAADSHQVLACHDLAACRAACVTVLRWVCTTDGSLRRVGGDNQKGSFFGGGGVRPADEEDLFSYFSARCYSGYGDDKQVSGARLGRGSGQHMRAWLPLRPLTRVAYFVS
jgi:hypothetical protein